MSLESGDVRTESICGTFANTGGPSDFFLRSELGRVNRLGIDVKRRARLRVTEKLLNRLHVFAPADQEGREAVTELVEAKPLTTVWQTSRGHFCFEHRWV